MVLVARKALALTLAQPEAMYRGEDLAYVCGPLVSYEPFPLYGWRVKQTRVEVTVSGEKGPR